MTGKNIDLRKLPAWLQYVIALSVVGIVVPAAWIVGRDQPVPSWITTKLIPALGWLYLVLFVYVILHRWFQKR